MRRPLLVLLLTLALAALVAAGCGSDSDGEGAAADTTARTTTTPQPATGTTTEEPEPTTGTTIKLAASQYGDIVFDGAGQAIYLFDKETTDASECYGDCAEAWPPVLTDGAPRAGAGIDAGLLGTTERDDGTTQVTYNGHPLYFYAHEGPTEVRCHNVPGFGGLWLAVDGQGGALPPDAPAA